LITNGRVSIGTAATAIDGVYNQHAHITIHNDDNTDAVYIGGSSVSTLNGLTLQKEETIQFTLAPLEQLYAISTKAGHTISYLRQTI